MTIDHCDSTRSGNTLNLKINQCCALKLYTISSEAYQSKVRRLIVQPSLVFKESLLYEIFVQEVA